MHTAVKEMCLNGRRHVKQVGKHVDGRVHTCSQTAHMNQQGGLRVPITQLCPHCITSVAGVEPDCVYTSLPHLYPFCGALVLCQLTLQHSKQT